MRKAPTVFERLGRFSNALADLDEAIKLGEDLRDSHRMRAWLRSKTGDDAGADSDFAAVIAAAPSDAKSYIERAKFYLDLGQYERATADVDRAIEISPKSAPALELRGALWIYRRNVLRGLTENVPSHPLAWNLGAPWSVEPRYLNLPQRDWYRQQYDQLRGRP